MHVSKRVAHNIYVDVLTVRLEAIVNYSEVKIPEPASIESASISPLYTVRKLLLSYAAIFRIKRTNANGLYRSSFRDSH